MPAPPEARWQGRNRDWQHLATSDILSMPDKWEYPWFAAWDMAFHMIPFAMIDPDFAKEQLIPINIDPVTVILACFNAARRLAPMRAALAGPGSYADRLRAMLDARIAAFFELADEGAHAADLLYSGRIVDAAEAKEMGLIT